MSKPKLLRRTEIAFKYGIPISTLKHMSSSRYKGIKPPMIRLGNTTFYDEHQFNNWYHKEINGENRAAQSAKLDIPIKLVK